MLGRSSVCVFFALFVVAFAANNCASVSQSKFDQWTTNNQKYTQWKVTLTAGSTEVHAASLTFSKSLYDYSELTKLGSVYSTESSIPARGTYSFEYTVRGSRAAKITVQSCSTTTFSKPNLSSSPSSSPPSHTISAPPPGPPDPSTATHCDVVFVFDSDIVRNAKLSNSDLIAKYTDYFTDTQTFYRVNFNIELRISHIYLEKPDSSFSDAMDANELLEAFRSAIEAGYFQGMPASACIYHLLTGKDIDGIGGLTWVGTACGQNLFNLGFTVDTYASEDPVSVIRRLTHEIGHSFGGNHRDYYLSNSVYTCDAMIGDDEKSHMHLRKVHDRTVYKYLTDELLMTECATVSIFNSLPNFACMWDENETPVKGSITLYTEKNFKGDSGVIPARYGFAKCYNIAYPFSEAVVGYRLKGEGAIGVRFFAHEDCVGEVYTFFGTSSSYLGEDLAKVPLSFMYVMDTLYTKDLFIL